MNVSAWSIRNPIPAVMLFVLLTFGGLLSFNAMKVQNFPDIDLPTVTVSASLPGAAPSQLETDVARKLENSIATVQGLKHITTKVQDGAATLIVEFRLEKPVQEAVDDVRSAVQRVRADLPADVRDPVVTKLDFAAQPVLAFTIASPRMDSEALSWFVDNDITKKLLALPGVGAVNRVGGVTRQVHVDLDPAKLQALGASAADISRQLRQVQTESAGGRIDLGGSEQPVRTLATVQSADQLADMQIALSDGRRIRLDQVARISDTIAEPRAAALLNGKPVVGFEVARSRGASEVEVGRAIQKALADLRVQRPDIELTEAFNFVDPVEEEYDGSLHLLYEGAILAVIVVWLFLRDWRATFVSAVALPMSVIPAFIGMHLLGFSVNVISLLALSLVVGILVDDAIVEVENIVRHLRMGKSPYEAAMEAADEIGLAVIATTFTLIAVFLPTAFMSGVAGKFFKQFGWTASLAVFASLVVARVLTPMMAAYILKPVVGAEKEPRWLTVYMRAVEWSTHHRFKTMVFATLFFFGSLAMIPLLKTGFIPPDDNSQTQIYLSLAPGSTLAQTTAAAEETRNRVMKIAHVKSVYTTVAGGSAGGDPFANFGTPETRKATLTIKLDDRGDRPRKQVIENQIRAALETLPGVRSTVGLGGSGEKYILALTGEDPAALASAASAVEKDLRTVPGLGQHHLHREPDPSRDRRAARLRARRRSWRDQLGHCRDLARGHAGRLRPGAGQAQPRATAGAHRGEARRFGAEEPGSARPPFGAGYTRPGHAEPGGVIDDGRRPGRHRPLRPLAERELRNRALGRGPGRCQDGGDIAAIDPEAAARRARDRDRRCGGDDRTVRELRPRDAHGRAVHLHRAGAAVQGLPASGDDSLRIAFGTGRGVRRFADRAESAFDAIADRVDHADGHRDQELDPAGRIRHRGAARPWHEPLGCAARRLPQACTAHHHDHTGHGRGHVADCGGSWYGGLKLPLADGNGGDRGADYLYRVESAGGAGCVHLCGRHRALDSANCAQAAGTAG